MSESTRREFLVKAGVGASALLVPGIALRAFANTNPIKIGGSLPLTGAYADTGIWVERGYRYWAETVNASGGLLGRPVELILYDDASQVDRGISALERAITVDRVDLLAGGYPGTTAAAQMATAERYRRVYVSMGGHMASFQRGFRYSFGAPPLMGEWWYEGAFQWLEGMPAADRPVKAAAITANNAVGMAVRGGLADGLARSNIELVMDELYDLPLASAEPLVARAKALGADMFIANGFFGDGVQTIRAMRALDYNPKVVLQGIGSLIPEWVQELGADGNYVISGTALHDKLPFKGVEELNEVARERWGLANAPEYFLFGYAWMQALQQGVEGSGSLDSNAIANHLRTKGIDGVAGPMVFDERGLPEPFSYTTQILDGRVELVWPPDVQTAQPVYPKPPWGR